MSIIGKVEGKMLKLFINNWWQAIIVMPTAIKLVKKNQKLHNPDSPLLIGDVKDGDVVNEVNEPSYIDTQTRLF